MVRTAPDTAPDASPAADAGAPRDVALYVHWPFCLAKCPYCDFNSHVRETIDADTWERALLAALDHAADHTDYRRLDSIFFGGGTPSLMPPGTVARVIDRAAARWSTDADLEITLEANPTSVEAAKFRDFRAAGANRVSIGVQALNDRDLKFLGREHSAGAARDAIAAAAENFARYSFDLIYARPDQTVSAWEAELAEALRMAGDHLSVYQLTIERGTPFFAAHRAGGFDLPNEDVATELYEITQSRLEDAGMPAYEISNHARDGGACRHNVAIWKGGDYIGIGPGAHGRITIAGTRYWTESHPLPEHWLDAVAARGGIRGDGALDAHDRLEELVLTGLRLVDGLSREDFRAQLGGDPEHLLDAAKLTPLIEGGFLILDAQGLRATDAGRLRLNAVIENLLS